MLLPKPARGSHVLAREAKRKELEDLEDAAKKRAKARDLFTCRWPEKHTCRGHLEGVHVFEDKKMGGDHGRLSDTTQIMAFCYWLHRGGPMTMHSKHLKVEPETDRGADGPCAFYKRETLDEPWTCVGVETAIHRIRKN
jgi:hypothetical protein